MKVILIKDLKGQGKKDDVIDVSDGYATNFLFKNGYAVEATKTSLNSLAIKKSAESHRKDVEREQALELSKRLNKISIQIPVKVSPNGKIFGALTTQTIAEELNKQQQIDLDKRKIVLDEPIKSVGRYEVTIKLYPNITAKINVIVTDL